MCTGLGQSVGKTQRETYTEAMSEKCYIRCLVIFPADEQKREVCVKGYETPSVPVAIKVDKVLQITVQTIMASVRIVQMI